jgi:hypothetical protein
LRDENHARTGQVRLDSEIDCQNLLFDLLEHWLQQLVQQPLDPNMKRNVQIIETAKEGRNKVCHAELVPITTNWHTYLTSWEDLCILISNSGAAQRIATLHVELAVAQNNSSVFTSAGNFLPTAMKATIRSKTRMIRIKLTKKPV